MQRPRISIAGLMALVGYSAIGFMAFRSAGDRWYGRMWNDGYYTLTVGALAVATIQASLGRDRVRARRLGFAVFGWAHLMFGWPDTGTTPLGGTWRPRFLHTEWLSHWLETMFLSGSHREEGTFKWHVIQSSITILTALIGGAIGDYLARRGEHRAE